MSNFIYSKMSGKNDPMFGKFEHPIKALIENESNACEKQKGVLDFLFNVEKSNRYAETIIGESDFDTFQSCLLYTSPSPRDRQKSRMPSSA